MPNISKHFELRLKQRDLDFVDVVLEEDNLLFINPQLIGNSTKITDRPIKAFLNTFFGMLILYLSGRNKTKALELLAGVQEPKETRFGYGKGNSNGNSAGKKLQEELVNALLSNSAIMSKEVINLEEVIFFVRNIGVDRVSDITTKIIKSFLIKFTQKQCQALGIQTEHVPQKTILNPSNLKWENKTVELPTYLKQPIIFVPKHFVCRENDSNSNFDYFFRFARNFIIESGDSEFLNNIPQNGKGNSILVKDFDNLLEDVKEELSKWVIKYPKILKDYREASYNRITPLTDAEIESIVYRKSKKNK